MKFDVVIGNPPYQGEGTGNKSYSAPIYPEFMDSSYTIGDKVLLITPGRFLFDAGGTKKAWNRKMLSDEHLKVLHYEMDSTEIFDNTDITGGVAITYRDVNSDFGSIDTFIPYDELQQILSKVKGDLSKGSIMDISYSASSYRFSQELFDDYSDNRAVMDRSKDTRLESNVFDKVPMVFEDSKPKDDNIEYGGIYGLSDRKRTFKWIDSKYLNVPDNFKNYKVLLPKSNGSGAIGEVSSTPLIGKPRIGEPLIGHTRTFMSFGNFDNKLDVESCMKYIKSKFSRVLLGTLKVTQSNRNETWKHIPLQDFTENSDIDWTKTIPEIDQQLYKKYNLSDEEIAFIETHVKEME